jgi:hypothetical protein
MPESLSLFGFEIDHVIAVKHGGRTAARNLALSCAYCNHHKGSNVAGVDPKTGRVVRLFHPRLHVWRYHFRYEGPVLVGRTAVGRATVEVLEVNQIEAIQQRALLIMAGMFPPHID